MGEGGFKKNEKRNERFEAQKKKTHRLQEKGFETQRKTPCSERGGPQQLKNQEAQEGKRLQT